MLQNGPKLFLLIVSLTAFGLLGAESQDAIFSITRERLAAHVKFLSSDLLEGRSTGTRGYDLAAAYVATQFEAVGLAPGVEKKSYFQEIPFRKTDIQPDRSSFTITSSKETRRLQYAEHYLMSGDYAREDASISTEMVFAGFGITAPEYKRDDYEGLDVKGKIVLLMSGAPATFPASERAHYSSSNTKQKNAVAHGAAGIVTFDNPQDAERSPWTRRVRQNKLSGYRWVDSQGKPNDNPLQIQSSAALSRAGADLLFSLSPKKLEEVDRMWKDQQVRGFPLGVHASLKKISKLDNVPSANVVGLLEGSDPALKNEYIVYTAHLDHLGISEPVNGDTINNGAYDNSTGIACLIEVARAFVQLNTRPKRSVLFVAVTAEEKGLQGSDYYAHHPTVPAGSIVANVNTDMFLMLFPFSDVVAFGSEHSTLGPVAEKVLHAVGLRMSPDPAPEEVRFVRSDQYSFIKQGIPAIKFGAGFQSFDSSDQGETLTKNWLLTVYHSPQDENTQTMHWESGVKLVQATFLLGVEIANARKRPEWNPGDFFGKTFGKMN